MTGQPQPPIKLTDEQRKMVEENMGLVGWAVSRWGRFLPVDGGVYTQADAYQDATFGLMRAVVKFDPDKGYRFATYARFWLQQSITRGQGTFEGLSQRRIAAGMDCPEDHRSVVSLWADDMSVERLSADDDVEADALRSTLWADVQGCREYACDDHRDRVVWDAMFTHTDTSSGLRAAADELGLTVEAVRNRWARLRKRIVALLEPEESRP